jgi:hypothetical protein
MPTEPKLPFDIPPMTADHVMAELLRENEKLRRQLADMQEERDRFKQYYLWEMARNAVEPTPEELANAVPAIPLIEAAIKRLERS